MKKCESCGMPMMKTSDFGGRKETNKYCVHCTYENGELKPQHEIREGMIKYYMRMKRIDRKNAEQFVEEHMSRMSAWQ
ncbi:zinc ribbon domain-containing protein [Candidatus Micrarchaeota archaeon]|nr:zinc ribbon domain-containing protein [Candidatus Micrarchaeota archaeon]